MSLRTGKHSKISLKKNAEASDAASRSISSSISGIHQTLEKRIEEAQRKSPTLGWDFTRFAVTMLEVLTILHEQDRLKAEKAKQQDRLA